MKNKIDFEGIAAVLAEFVEKAKAVKILRENSTGDQEEYSISDISFGMLINESISNEFLNGAPEDFDSYDLDATMLIRIWVDNGKKVCSSHFYGIDHPLDPLNVRICMQQNMYDYLSQAVDSFISLKAKSNKYHVVTPYKGEYYRSKNVQFRNFSKNTLNIAKQHSYRMYLLERVNRCSVALSKTRRTNIVCNSWGANIVESNIHISFYSSANVYTKQKTVIKTLFTKLYLDEPSLFSDVGLIDSEMRKAIDNVVDTRLIKAGFYPMLFDSAASHTLFHESIGAHMLSGTFIANSDSMVFKDKIGKNIADEIDTLEALRYLTIYSMPRSEGFVASYLYDCEGVPSKNQCLIDNGVLHHFLTDLNSAARLKMEPSGNALCESYIEHVSQTDVIVRMPEARVSNLIIQSNINCSNDELRGQIVEFCKENGYEFYLELSSKVGMVDVQTGNFQMTMDNITMVYLDGRKEKVLGGVLAGDLFSFVSAIQGISSEYEDDIGMCGSTSGYVLTHGRAPSMFLHGINFTPLKHPDPEDNYDLGRDKYIPQEIPD